MGGTTDNRGDMRSIGTSRKALITGGAGFIGSHLAESLLADGWEVYALDDLSTGSIDNVAHLLERRDFHLVVESVLTESVVNELSTSATSCTTWPPPSACA